MLSKLPDMLYDLSKELCDTSQHDQFILNGIMWLHSEKSLYNN